ncbi:MAG: hypothetical protein KDC92_08085, partial [Bacteroidetes bacterium]|nr:hypothetical protein [Bacteroidota bacterium]
MKKILLPICALLAVHFTSAQVVIDYHAQVDEINENPVVGQPRLGEEMEFDWYYKRRTGLEVGTAVVSFNGTPFYCTPGQTNYDTIRKEGFWAEIGQRIQFRGDARCMGVYIVYQNYDRQEGGDNFDITFYKTEGGMPTDVPYSNKVFSGDQIQTGPDKDSFTYIAFNSGDPTDVTKDFVIGLALQEVTEFGDKLDEVTVYTSRKGDGKGEKNAMVKVTQKSLLASKIPFGQTELWIPLDEVFKDNAGKFFEFDIDFMIIPVMDVTKLSDGRIELNNA